MKRYANVMILALTTVGAAGLLLDAISTPDAQTTVDAAESAFTFVQEDSPQPEPLVLSLDDDAPNADEELEDLPPTAVEKVSDAPELVGTPDFIIDDPEGDAIFDEDEMRELARQPLFREFKDIIGDAAPLPDSIDVDAIDVPGAQLLTPGSRRRAVIEPQKSAGEIDAKLEALLSETLAVADVDLSQFDLLPSQRQTLETLDAEIGRLWPLWIDAELNRHVVGRRERDWRQHDFSRFSGEGAPVIETPGSDWSLALDEPFWFQVVDLITGENFYTKAGDFEQIDSTGSIALLRDERRFALVMEEGRVAPTGRAMRVRILKDGRIQGVDASDKLVTDVNLGQIPLFIFQNPARLDSRDGVFFTATPFSGAPQRAVLNAGTPVGVNQRRLVLSNGKPEEILQRVSVLCKTKARLVELITHTKAVPSAVHAGVPAAVTNKATLPASVEVTNEATEEEEDVETIPTPATLDDSNGVDRYGFTIPDDEQVELVLPEE